MRKEKYEDEQKDWRDYERCKDFLERKGFYTRNNTCYSFFEGDQWGEKVPDGEALPQLNILRQQVEYKVATVMQNGFSLYFSNAEHKDEALGKLIEVVAEKMNGFIAKTWEHSEMDTKLWICCTDACISGGVGIYSFVEDGQVKIELKNNTDVLFADEQQADLQKQKFIILPYRRMVSEVREEARLNGIPEFEIKNIVADNDTKNMTGDYTRTEIDEEADDDGGKCLCILKLWKDKDGFVWFRKSTATKIFCKATKTPMKRYPVDFMAWNLIKGSARGKGDVAEWIPNQVAINKNLARREMAIKTGAFPVMVYDSDQIDNPDDLTTVGAVIGIKGGYTGDVKNMIGYVQPQAISPDATNFTNELIQRTQELSGASTYALGNIDPSKTSGRAILAVRDAAAVPLNIQISRLQKFVEDIGKTWWELLATSNPNGLEIEEEITVTDENGQPVKQTIVETIPAEVMPRLKFNIRADVSSANVFSKYAVEQTLENLFTQGVISFNEWVDALPDDSSMPKDKLEKIVQQRAEIEQIVAERDAYKQKYEELANAIPQARQLGENILAEMMLKKGNNAADKNEAKNTAPTA